jgi:hypothetical protein
MSEHSLFWDESRVATFSGLMRDAMECCNVEAATFQTFVKANVNPLHFDDLKASYPTYYRMLRDPSRKVRPKTYSGLLVAFVAAFEKKREFGKFSKEHFEKYFKLFREYKSEISDKHQEYKNENKLLNPMPSEITSQENHKKSSIIVGNENMIQNQKIDNVQINIIANFMMSVMGMDSTDLKSASDMFFVGEQHIKRFITFRFSHRVGYIQKSLTVLQNTNKENPFVTFKNFFEVRGRKRVAQGIAIPFKQQILFVGKIDKTVSAKIMTLKRVDSPQNYYTGLLLTTEPNGLNVASRFAMIETEIHDHTNIGKFEITAKEMSEDFPNIIDDIRNFISFNLEKQIFDSTGNPISQQDIVSLIGHAVLTENKLKLIDESGKIFNPASEDHYTFNSALSSA